MGLAYTTLTENAYNREFIVRLIDNVYCSTKLAVAIDYLFRQGDLIIRNLFTRYKISVKL